MTASTATPTVPQLWARFNEYLLANGFEPLRGRIGIPIPQHFSETVNESRRDYPGYNNYGVFIDSDLFTNLLIIWCQNLNPTLLNEVDVGEETEIARTDREEDTPWENIGSAWRLYWRLEQYASDNPGEIRFE